MEKNSVSVRGKIAPMVVLLVTAIVVLVIAPNAIQKAIGESRNVSKSQNSTEGQVVYEDYVRATALLKSGDVEGARQIIDRQQEASIAISINEGMSGALANSSGSMLILRLAKAISRYASEKAWNGDTEGALAWVERCRMLSRQSLSSTTITLESVQLAGSLDRLILETEARTLFASGNPSAAEHQMRRVQEFDRFWKNDILRKMRAVRQQCDSFRLAMLTGKTPETEIMKAQEQKSAEDLYKQYLQVRRRMRIV